MKPPAFTVSLCALVGSMLTPALAGADDQPVKPERVQEVLKTHCVRCHGQDGAAEGGFNFVLDLGRIVARKKITPGDPSKSPLFQRVAKGKMPPPDIKQRPSEQEIAALKSWIEQGAPHPTSPRIKLIAEADLYELMLADLEKVEQRSRRFIRYFSLAPQRNCGCTIQELTTFHQALSKLLNSLSWHYRITRPALADETGVLLRIDLRDFQWDANVWNRLLGEYPYGIIHDSATARGVQVATGTRMPIVRADWFLANASRAPLYYDLLQLPTTAAELERQLRVDVQVNLQQERVMRAGFNGSGISQQNRLIERHDALHGAYWRTFDFDPIPQNLVERELLLPDRRNLFAYPLGPGLTENTFRHAGGELIFNLPNGLQGYMLVNADGLRINKGPTQIVSDPKRPDRAVEAGVSCMGCHVTGILPKADQIRAHVQKNAKYFSKADADLLLALHPPEEKLKKRMDEDAERFSKAIEQSGGHYQGIELVSLYTRGYESDVDLGRAADELGMEWEQLSASIQRSPALARNLGPLLATGGTISRQVFIQSFADAVRELKLGTPLPVLGAGAGLLDITRELDPLESSVKLANAAAFTSDGRLALLASADKSVIVWEIERNIELRRLVGHTASVWCVAISLDGKQALSGGADNTVRLWDIESGRELRRLEGHSALVASVAFSPEGRHALSAGYDRGLSLWNLDTGNEERRSSGQSDYVNAVSFTPDGKHAVLATGKSLALFDLATGESVRRFVGHTSSVVCIASSPGGRWLASGSDDRSIRLWDRDSGKQLLHLTGHDGPVRSLAFAADGRRLVSGGGDGTVRVWDVGTGELLKRFGPLDDAVVGVTPLRDRGVLAVTRAGTVRSWGLARQSSQDVITIPTAEYLRPTKDGFARECEFMIDEEDGAWSIRSTTFRGKTTLAMDAKYDKSRKLTSAVLTLQEGDAKKIARVELAGDKAVVRRDGQADQEFTVPPGVIITSAPDWTDTFLMCRRFDPKGPAKQEFKGLWIHPTQTAQLLTFTIEHVGFEQFEHLGKKQSVTCALIRIRGNSPYAAWIDEHGRMLKLVSLPYKQGASSELLLKGYEKSAAKLAPPASLNAVSPQR